MKTALMVATTVILWLTNAVGQGKVLTNDPLTGLPLISATDPGKHIANLAYTYNAPSPLPASQVCKSKLQGEFYLLYNTKVDAVVEWYSSHLSAFKKSRGYANGRSQTAFYNSDGTIVIFVTGTRGPNGQNTDAYSVAYERFQPGLSEKTLASVTQETTVCP
jgi:hypothetical protein